MQSILAEIAHNQWLAGLAIITTLVAGIAMILSVISRIGEFFRINHAKVSDIRNEYLCSLANAAQAGLQEDIVLYSLLWVRLGRILSHFIYFFIALATTTLVRMAGVMANVMPWYLDEALKIGIYFLMLLSAIIIAFTIFEIDKICRTVLKIRTGSERGF